MVVKENTAPPKKCREGRGNYMLDAENAAVLRTHAHHMALFRRAGYRVVKSTRQADFPRDIYPVRRSETTPASTRSGTDAFPPFQRRFRS